MFYVSCRVSPCVIVRLFVLGRSHVLSTFHRGYAFQFLLSFTHTLTRQPHAHQATPHPWPPIFIEGKNMLKLLYRIPIITLNLLASSHSQFTIFPTLTQPSHHTQLSTRNTHGATRYDTARNTQRAHEYAHHANSHNMPQFIPPSYVISQLQGIFSAVGLH